jgi:hypothetical protein
MLRSTDSAVLVASLLSPSDGRRVARYIESLASLLHQKPRLKLAIVTGSSKQASDRPLIFRLVIQTVAACPLLPVTVAPKLPFNIAKAGIRRLL